jgi:uncharacterized protein GlcG (DUF336 family)
MKHQLSIVLGAVAVLVTSAALAAGSGLPGDTGRPLGGLMPLDTSKLPPPPPEPPAARAPALALALKAAQAIAAGCKQFHLGVAVVNAEGGPILFYIPDGSRASHSYGALRKAYTAIHFKEDSSKVMRETQKDPAVAAQITADPNLQAFGGAVLLKVGDEIVGAIGVSGAEPGGHDEECALIGLAAIKAELK